MTTTTVRRGNLISKAQILHALKFRGSKTFNSELLGGEVLIKELSAEQGKAINEAANFGKDNYDSHMFLALVFQAGVIDPETGDPMFSYEEAVELLAEGRTSALDQVAAEILDLNKMKPDNFRDGDSPADPGQRDSDAGAGPGEHRTVLTG